MAETLRPTTHSVEVQDSAQVIDPANAYDNDPATYARVWAPNAMSAASLRVAGFPDGAIAPANRSRVLLAVTMTWAGVPPAIGDLRIIVNGGAPALLANFLFGVGFTGEKLYDITALCAGEAITTVEVFHEIHRETGTNPPPMIIHGGP